MHPAVVYAVTSQHLHDRHREARQARPIQAETPSIRQARRSWRAVAVTLRLPGFAGRASEPAS